MTLLKFEFYEINKLIMAIFVQSETEKRILKVGDYAERFFFIVIVLVFLI